MEFSKETLDMLDAIRGQNTREIHIHNLILAQYIKVKKDQLDEQWNNLDILEKEQLMKVK